MAKKKSKTQKYKKNLKKKQQKVQTPKTPSNKSTKSVQQTPKPKTTQTQKNKQVVPKNEVKYNVVLNKETAKKIQPVEKPAPKEVKEKKQKNSNLNVIKNKFKKIKEFIFKKKEQIIKNYEFKKKNKKKAVNNYSKSIKKDIPVAKKVDNKNKETKKKPKNIFLRLLYEVAHNTHIIFNTLIVVTFIIMLIGLIRINVLGKGTIIYICCIVLFLMTVAISYNRYISGKVFTLILTAMMGFAIYQMQYTYDFIRNLNSNVYEYKTYYVVTLNTSVNRSIYTINNKKVGLLKENCINIERKLNTKLDKVNYLEYDNINDLFKDFYNQKMRAVLINDNQYKYLTNYIEEGSRDVKILYEFKVNAKK